MSNFQFLNHQSPATRKNPLAAQGVMLPNANIVIQPTSTKAVYKQQSSPNIYAFRNIQPSQWAESIDSKRRDMSPIRYNSHEEKPSPQYNFRPIVLQKRESVGLANYRIERTPQHIRFNRDISPLGKSGVHNEGIEYPPRAIRIDQRGIRSGEKEGSWNKLLNRSQEQAIVRKEKYSDWKKLLDEQVKEKQIKKHLEEERRRNQEEEAENRYQRQIEELSGEIYKRKINLQKSGVLRLETHVYPSANASPLGQINSNINNNTNTKSHKELRGNRENLAQVLMPIPVPKNIRDVKRKGNQREEDSIHLSYSIEKQENRSRNEGLNQYIDNLKAEILQGQQVFQDHIKELKKEVYKLGKFRNVAERNMLGGVGLGKGGGISLPSHLTHKDIYGVDSVTSSMNTLEPSVRSRKAKPLVQEEEKFKWDTDDFYSKLPPAKQLLGEAQKMVKIEPVTEELLAYKQKPESAKKKWFDEEDNILELKLETTKKDITKENKDENKVIDEQQKNIDDQAINLDTNTKDNKLDVILVQTTKEDVRILPSLSSIAEIKETTNVQEELEPELTLKSQNEILSKPVTQISIASPRNEERAPQQDYLQITKNLQPLTMMLKNSKMNKDGTVTPSIEDATRRDQPSAEAFPMEKLSQKEERTAPTISTSEDMAEKEIVKVRRPVLVERERKSSGLKNREVKNINVKNNVALKALSKFVVKDGLDAKIANDQKLQADPLARLDFMIDYLFNYNPQK